MADSPIALHCAHRAYPTLASGTCHRLYRPLACLQVRVYNLAKQALAKKLVCGSGVITSMAVHPTGDHIIMGSEDKRLRWAMRPMRPRNSLPACLHWPAWQSKHVRGHTILPSRLPAHTHRLPHSIPPCVCSWFDLDLSAKPYRSLRYHQYAVRGAAFHRSYPLFASSSDDATVHIFHGMVYSDLMTNPLIVPGALRFLRA